MFVRKRVRNNRSGRKKCNVKFPERILKFNSQCDRSNKLGMRMQMSIVFVTSPEWNVNNVMTLLTVIVKISIYTIDNSGKCIKSVGKKELSKMRVISTLSQESLKYLTCVKNKRQNKMLNSPNDINIIPRHDPFATPKEKRR